MSREGHDPATPRARLVAASIVLVLVALSVWGGLRLRVATDIRHFIPTQSDRELSEVSGALAESTLTRTMVLAIEGPKAAEAATQMRQRLAAHEEVEWVYGGIDGALQETLRALYLPRRMYLQRPALSPQALREEAADLKRTLSGPKGSLLRALVPSDPLLLFTAFLERLRDSDGGELRSDDGQFVTDSGAAVLFVRTRSSAFDSIPQARFQADLAAMVEALRTDVDPELELSQSGLARFAIAAESSTKADVSRVSVASTISIVVVFVLVFGQVRALVLAFFPVVLGVGGGIVACSLLVDEVHGLTLAFGAALLGVGVDYALHLMFHLGHRGTQSPGQVIARVRPGLLLGAATTIVGLAGLALTTFPGMRELSLFGAAGVAGSLLVTLLLVPAFGSTLPERRVRRWLIARSRQAIDRLNSLGVLAWAFYFVVVSVGATGLFFLQWTDGLRALYQVDAELMAEDTRVREMTGAIDMSRMVLSTGADTQQALERNDRVFSAVARADVRGDLEGFRSVHTWLPSVSWQRENLARLQEPTFEERFATAFEREGFRPGVLARSLTSFPRRPKRPSSPKIYSKHRWHRWSSLFLCRLQTAPSW